MFHAKKMLNNLSDEILTWPIYGNDVVRKFNNDVVMYYCLNVIMYYFKKFVVWTVPVTIFFHYFTLLYWKVS